jgi:hypothetical protein
VLRCMVVLRRRSDPAALGDGAMSPPFMSNVVLRLAYNCSPKSGLSPAHELVGRGHVRWMAGDRATTATALPLALPLICLACDVLSSNTAFQSADGEWSSCNGGESACAGEWCSGTGGASTCGVGACAGGGGAGGGAAGVCPGISNMGSERSKRHLGFEHGLESRIQVD